MRRLIQNYRDSKNTVTMSKGMSTVIFFGDTFYRTDSDAVSGVLGGVENSTIGFIGFGSIIVFNYQSKGIRAICSF